MNPKSKTVFYAFLSIGIALLAIDFLFIYLPLSGWVLQSILVGVYLEYLKIKKTLLLIAIMEIFFMTSYGGTVAISAILSLFSAVYAIPLIAGLYLGLIGAVFFLGLAANYFFHRIGLFTRLGHKKVNRGYIEEL